MPWIQQVGIVEIKLAWRVPCFDFTKEAVNFLLRQAVKAGSVPKNLANAASGEAETAVLARLADRKETSAELNLMGDATDIRVIAILNPNTRVYEVEITGKVPSFISRSGAQKMPETPKEPVLRRDMAGEKRRMRIRGTSDDKESDSMPSGREVGVQDALAAGDADRSDSGVAATKP